MCSYKVKRVLEFKNDKQCKTEYFSVGDSIIMIYEDINEGNVEIKGEIVGVEDEGYLLIASNKTLGIHRYYLYNVRFISKA